MCVLAVSTTCATCDPSQTQNSLQKEPAASNIFAQSLRRSGTSVLRWGVEVLINNTGRKNVSVTRGEAAMPVVRLRYKPQACDARWLPRKTPSIGIYSRIRYQPSGARILRNGSPITYARQ